LELIKTYVESIKISDEHYSQYSSMDDSINANRSLKDLVNYIRQKDSLNKINDSLSKELKKY
ncbi:MAG TPA: hypothetical protein VGO09_08360, partial [Flavisolibacter sp.]|nr:hypothetical protein [Flavisolibacter sp.]